MSGNSSKGMGWWYVRQPRCCQRRFEVVDLSERGQRSSEALLCIVPSVLTQAAPPVPVPDQAG